ncbi:hypothetical protein BDZ94DRAFT_1378089, partial [Collybia nuda]
LWTGKWWNAIQALLPKGATLAPLIIATDKTNLTQFSGGKQAYLVYLTIGNIPRAIRRKPSKHACVLIGYLSCLFHESMRAILQPLIEAGKNGVEMVGGDGAVRRVHPVLACYAADYPEQTLVACTKYGTCPKCQVHANELQDIPGSGGSQKAARTPAWTTSIIRDAKLSSNSTAQFHEKCMEHEVSGSLNSPFWAELPYTDVHLSMTPDVLHQLYQGVLKHLIGWCQKAMSSQELDCCIRSLPPAMCYGC